MRNDSYKDLISKEHCYGCGICAVVCPFNVLTMQLNSDGFYIPKALSPEKCISCGMCTKVCSYQSDMVASSVEPIKSFAGWSNHPSIRYQSSSGGVAMEIAKYGIEHGFKVCTVKYSSFNNRPEHYVADTIESLKESLGSKYLQSYTLDGFAEVNLNEKNIIIGTPCQIDMWRRYLRMRNKENNFILIDFFCHGVPSMHLWKKYLKEHHELIPNSLFTWRDKINGWHSSWNICAYSSNEIHQSNPYYRSSAIKDRDLFYSLFLGNYCLNRSCYSKCKYKLCNSSADIRLGDFWGDTYSNVDDGVNSILVFNSKGMQLLENIDITYVAHNVTDVCDGQMHQPIRKPWYYEICALALRLPFIKLTSIRAAIVFEEVISYQFKKLKRNK